MISFQTAGRSIALILLLLTTGAAMAQEEQKSPIATFIEPVWQKMRSVGAREFKPDSSDTTFEGMAIFLDFVERTEKRWGKLIAIEKPTLISGNKASVVVRFEQGAYEFVFVFDSEGKIDSLKVTNYVPPEDRSTLSLADLGSDTLLVTEMTSLAQLRDAFRSDSCKVRLVSILSPT